jgi:hypothetical protein
MTRWRYDDTARVIYHTDPQEALHFPQAFAHSYHTQALADHLSLLIEVNIINEHATLQLFGRGDLVGLWGHTAQLFSHSVAIVSGLRDSSICPPVSYNDCYEV